MTKQEQIQTLINIGIVLSENLEIKAKQAQLIIQVQQALQAVTRSLQEELGVLPKSEEAELKTKVK